LAFESGKFFEVTGVTKGNSGPVVSTPGAQRASLTSEQKAAANEKAKQWLGPNCRVYFERHLDHVGKFNSVVFAYTRGGIWGDLYTCGSSWGLTQVEVEAAAIARCESERAKQDMLRNPCEIFAVDDKIVWKGEIRALTQAKNTSGAVGRLADAILCHLALDARYNFSRWDERPNSDAFAVEARKRSLTVEKCRKIAGIEMEKNAASSKSASIEERLKELKRLLDAGLISNDDARAKREEILRGL
jgi:hypothetical protein